MGYDDEQFYVGEVWEVPKVMVMVDQVGAKLPTKGYADDVGWDLYSLKSIKLKPLEIAEVPTGLRICIPEGFYAQTAPRSSGAKRGLMPLLTVFDAGYTGPLAPLVVNLSKKTLKIEEGEKFCQLIIGAVIPVKWELVDLLPETQRGAKRYGSTGRR